MSKLSFASLFSGGGGADCGLQSAGLEHGWGLEWDSAIAEVYRENIGICYNQNILESDPFKFERIDWLHASPPCQAFSTANANRGERQLEIDCAKKVAEFIEVLQPQYFSLENVEAYRKSESFYLIVDKLNRLGYWSNWQVLNSADFGVPQSRRRLILTAIKGGFLPSLPPKEKWIGWKPAIQDLIPDFEKFWFADWMLELSQGYKPPYIMSATEMRNDHSIRLAYEPCFTLKACDNPPRIMLECGLVVRLNNKGLARLQSFPDDYKFPQKKSLAGKIIGNSVPPLMIEKIARNIIL